MLKITIQRKKEYKNVKKNENDDNKNATKRPLSKNGDISCQEVITLCKISANPIIIIKILSFRFLMYILCCYRFD